MSNYYGVQTYRAHDLNISMRTSSGDTITMDFANYTQTSMSYSDSGNKQEAQMSFSSMQSFEFSMKTNGISEQDQKEIDAFMELAQPYIDNFLAELSSDAPTSPVTKVAKDIASLFEPNKERSLEQKDYVKSNIVEMFDNSLATLELPKTDSIEDMLDKIYKETQKLLEKTLKEFDEFNKLLYA